MNTQVAQTVLGPMNGHKERAVPSFRCLEVKTKKKTRAIFNNPTSLADIAFFLAAVLMQWKSRIENLKEVMSPAKHFDKAIVGQASSSVRAQ